MTNPNAHLQLLQFIEALATETGVTETQLAAALKEDYQPALACITTHIMTRNHEHVVQLRKVQALLHDQG